MEEKKVLPEGLGGWNWGAFLMTWIWGIKFKVWVSLLALIPPISYAMPFVLGACGTKMAWKNGKWESVEQFKKEQKKWVWYACALLVVEIILFIIIMVSL